MKKKFLLKFSNGNDETFDLNILIVTQFFWPENFRINDLAQGLLEKGHSVTILTGIPNYPEGRFFPGYGVFKKRGEDYKGVKVVRVPLVPRGKGNAFRLALNYLSFALFGSILGPLFCIGKFDLIFVFQPSPVTTGLPALAFKRLKKIPIMFWVQDLWPETLSATGFVKSKLLLKMVERLVRFIYQRCDRILVQSKAFSPSVQGLGVNVERILYFPNYAEELYKPLKMKPDAPELIGMPLGFRVMFAGNIGIAQDFSTILSAAELLRERLDIHWVILGDGSVRKWVETQIHDRGLSKNVHLLGRHPMELMPRFFSLADIMLVTLKKDYIFSLTIPAKVQSYLACAKPIVAALDGEGARVIEESGAGLTCPAEAPVALSEAVLAMYHLPESERIAMGVKGLGYFEKHFERSMLLNRLNNWMEGLQREK